MKSGIKILFLVLSLMLITLMIATLGDFLKMRFNSIWEGSIVELQEGWTLSVDDVVIDSQFTLPNLIKNEDLTGKHVVLTNTIPDTGAPLSSLLMRTSQKTVSISIDGEKIYTQDGNIGNRKIKLPGYINHFAWLKPNIGGKTLTIESVAYSPKTSGQFYEVYLGTRVGQISLLFRYDGVSLIVGVIILICSFIVLLSSPIFLRKLQVYHGALAFAGIELCVGLWVCGGTMSTQLIIHNQLILLFFGIFALFMLPVFLTWFVISMYQIPLASLFSKVVVLFPLTFIGVSFFQLLGIVTYYTILTPVAIVLLLYLLALNGATWQAYKRGERRARQFLIATGFLLLAIVGELILLLLPFETFINALVFNIGVLAFGIILFSQIVKQIIRFFKQRGKEEYLATLVYTDELTTLSNRRAFDEYLNQLRKPQTHLDGIGIAIFDVNDLKKVNDEEGHAAGDRLLKETASLLKTLYGEIGTLYRIGGDEFALICTSSTLDTLKEIKSLLLGKNLNVACGSALYEKGITTSIDDLFEKADKRMYTYKHRMKHPYGVSRGQ